MVKRKEGVAGYDKNTDKDQQHAHR